MIRSVGDRFDEARIEHYATLLKCGILGSLEPEQGETAHRFLTRSIQSLCVGFESLPLGFTIEPISEMSSEIFSPDKDEQRIAASFEFSEQFVLDMSDVEKTDPKVCAALSAELRFATDYTLDAWTPGSAIEQIESSEFMDGPENWWSDMREQAARDMASGQKKKKIPTWLEVRQYVRRYEIRTFGYYVREIGKAHEMQLRGKGIKLSHCLGRAEMHSTAFATLVSEVIAQIETLHKGRTLLDKAMNQGINQELRTRYGMPSPSMQILTKTDHITGEVLEDLWQMHVQSFPSFSPNYSVVLAPRPKNRNMIRDILSIFAEAHQAVVAIDKALGAYSAALRGA